MEEIYLEKFLGKLTRKKATEHFNRAINIGVDFKLRKKVIDKNIKELKKDNLLHISDEGLEIEDILDYFESEILPYSTNFSSEQFMGFPDAGNSISGITGAILADFAQQNLINSSFCAPIATKMEIDIIKFFRESMSYKTGEINSILDVGGVVTNGGTGSNAIAMLLARENHVSNTMQHGINHPEKFKVIVPEGIGHYSISSSLMWLGLGENIIEVPTKNYRYDLKKLKNALDKNKGKVMCVVAYAGDSRTQTIENLTAVSSIVRRCDENIWLHADACHGFSLAFSDKYKEKIKGLSEFDSISTDPHKVLNLPYCLSIFMVKDPEKMQLITTKSDLITKEEFSLGQITPFIGSKNWTSLKLWFFLMNLGKDDLRNLIDHRLEYANFAKKVIRNNPKLLLLNEVDINSVMFMYIPEGKEQDISRLNEVNRNIYNKLLEDGDFYVHQFPIKENNGIFSKETILYPLRYMSGNPTTSKESINKLIENIIDLGTKFEKEGLNND